MQSHLSHLQFNVHADNLSFYKELLTYLGWHIVFDSEEMIGLVDKNGVSLWFGGQVNDSQNDYDGPGMNHLAIGVVAQTDVDAAAAYLIEHDVALLFETPRHRPEFSRSAEHTYYQVMFETPDHILMEVVYTGVKSL